MTAVAKNPEVIYTELEDGAVLLNMENGFYYSLDLVGVEVWRRIEPANGAPEIGTALTAMFDVSAERASAAVARFVNALLEERLVLAAEHAAAVTTGEAWAGSRTSVKTRPFSDPVLLKHDEPLNQVSLHPFDPQLPLAE
ncbi:MAG TPA: PqqD family protein [Gemmatimonadaceae bacterium]|nr:PqqD family protein [Gemmatimonadaceae bacterium]